jgi:hypothetical protein
MNFVSANFTFMDANQGSTLTLCNGLSEIIVSWGILLSIFIRKQKPKSLNQKY